MSEVKSEVVERLRARISNHTKIHVARLANIVDTVTYLLNEKGYSKEKIDSAPITVENWFTHNFKFSLKNISKLETILKETIITIMMPQEYKSKLIDEILENIPSHTANYMEMEMLILSRISDLLEIDGWTADKVNKNTPEIIRAWYKEQFDFSLLSIAKMEDALKGKIINVVDYSDQIINN